jgi:hypothetical protein
LIRSIGWFVLAIASPLGGLLPFSFTVVLALQLALDDIARAFGGLLVER